MATTYENGQHVQVKNAESGHWVHGKVISTEPEGIAVQYGKDNRNAVVDAVRVRLPQPKGVRKGRKHQSKNPIAKAVPAKATVQATNTGETVTLAQQDEADKATIAERAQEQRAALPTGPKVNPFVSDKAETPEPVNMAVSRALKALDDVAGGLNRAHTQRAALDNEIAALSLRKTNIETFLKLSEEFNR